MSRIVHKNWGHEEIIHNGEYCCKRLVYTHPKASSLHCHVKKHETFVVGAGIFVIDNGLGATKRMVAGDWVVLPPRYDHRIRCLKPGFIVEASTHDDPEDCVRLELSEP